MRAWGPLCCAARAEHFSRVLESIKSGGEVRIYSLIVRTVLCCPVPWKSAQLFV